MWKLTKNKFTDDLSPSLLQRYQVDPNALSSLLIWIAAPPNLNQFAAVTKNLQRFLQITLPSSLRAELDLSDKQLQQWRELLMFLDTQFQQPIPSELAGLQVQQQQPERGLIGLYPVYAALTAYEQTYPPNEIDKITHLQFIALCCAIKYQKMQESGIIKTKSSGFETGLREIRDIETNKFPNLHYPDVRYAQSLLEVQVLLEDWLDENPATKWGDGLRLLFESVVQKLDRQERSFRFHIKTESKRSYHQIAIHGDDDTDDSPEQGNSGLSVELVNRQVNTRTSSKLYSDGLHPAEMQTIDSLLIHDKTAPPAVQADERLVRHRSKRGIQAALTKSAQQLPNDWQVPTPYELASLFHAIHSKNLFTQALPNLSSYEHLELQCMLLLRLYTGRSLSSLHKLVIVKNKASYLQLKRLRLTFLLEEQQLVLPIISTANDHSFKDPTIQRLLAEPPFTHIDINLKDVIYLQLPEATTSLISTQATAVTAKKTFKQLSFFQKNAPHREWIRQLFKVLNKHLKTRWTEHRLSLIMRLALQEYTKNQSFVQLITEQELGHSVVSTYYQRVSLPYLAQITHNAYKWIQHWTITGLSTSFPIRISDKKTEEATSIGSHLALPETFITELCQHLKQGINKSWHMKASDDRLRETHNSLVAYITVWLSFISGYRAVLNPLSHPHDVDKATRLMVISDKDNELYQHTRIIPLTLRFLEQIDSYAQHLTKLAEQLPHKTTLKENIYELTDTYRQPSPQTVTPKTPFLFFLSKTLQVQAVSPTHLTPHYPFALKPNVSRHYLRSKLIELGAPAECISYFLGHWESGEEPYQKYSSISYIALAMEMAPYIEILEKKAQWTVQRGLAHE